MRASSSSISRIFLSNSSTPLRALKPWMATAARPRSWEPSSTASTTSEMRRLRSRTSLLPPPLPPLDAAHRRLSALAGSCHQQYCCGGSTLAVHLEPSLLIPEQTAIKYGPPPGSVPDGPRRQHQRPRLRRLPPG